jgi:small subunit ribosomal protein S3Ae
VYDVKTKDGYIIRVKPMAITERRIQSSKQKLIRKIAGDVIGGEAELQTLSEFVRGIISNELAKKIFRACKPIYPIKRVEISKTVILKVAEGEEVPPPPELQEEALPEEATEEGEAEAGEEE